MRRTPLKPGIRLAAVAVASAAALAAAPGALAHGASGHGGPWPHPHKSSDDVYTMTNAAAGNSLLVFDRGRDGSLTPRGSYATGGNGSGAGLGSGHSVVTSGSGRVVLAVNAGSDTVSAFTQGGFGLNRLGAPAPSGGSTPTSVTVHGHLVYVMNAGSGTISGLWLSDWGLTPIPGSTLPLSIAGTANDSQIQFADHGRVLVVTERGNNTLQTFVIGRGGRAQPAESQTADGGAPFGFDIDTKGHVLISDAALATMSGASSYDVNGRGELTANGPAVSSGQAAACWLAAVGRFAYTTNAGSGSISRFAVADDGTLSLTGATPIAVGAHPLDEAGAASRYLYVLADGLHQIIGYQVGWDGGLTPVSTVSVPTGAAGVGAH